MTRNIKRILTLVLTLAAVAMAASAQTNSREYIRNAIKRWGECRNVAITRTNGDVAIYGDSASGYSCCNVPVELKTTLSELCNEGRFIDDVQLTEKGNWLVLYGKNSMTWSGVPATLEPVLHEVYDDDETVYSVTFNDQDEWILISDEYIRASDNDIQQWIADGMNELGKVYSACMTDNGLIVVFEEGFRYAGNVPDDLLEKLETTDIDIYRVKFSGKSWFIADASGRHYNYKM